VEGDSGRFRADNLEGEIGTIMDAYPVLTGAKFNDYSRL
jgi:hypothetical protein